MKKKATINSGSKLIAENRSATYRYLLIEKVEAGLTLEGWEVKAIRSGRVTLKEGHILFRRGEAFLVHAHIAPLPQASAHRYADPKRDRKLLLAKRELLKLQQKSLKSGYTAIPVELHWRGRWVKLTLALARGKKLHDARRDEAERSWERERARLMKTAPRDCLD